MFSRLLYNNNKYDALKKIHNNIYNTTQLLMKGGRASATTNPHPAKPPLSILRNFHHNSTFSQLSNKAPPFLPIPSSYGTSLNQCLMRARIHSSAPVQQKTSKNNQEIPTALNWLSKLSIQVGLILVAFGVAFIGSYVLEEDPEPLLMDQPTVVPSDPSADELLVARTKLNYFRNNPQKGIILSNVDLNTYTSIFAATKDVKKYFYFRPFTEDGIVPVEVSVPLEGGKFFNCVVYYKLLQTGPGKSWCTKAARIEPVYSSAQVDFITAKFFCRNFLNPEVNKIDDFMRPILEQIETVKIESGELWINKHPPPKEPLLIEDNKLYDLQYTEPFKWIEEITPSLGEEGEGHDEVFSWFCRTTATKSFHE